MRQDNITFSLDIKNNSHIAKAWELFTECGELKTSNAVRKVISQSWHKSRELGIRPDIERAQTVITANEIEEKIRNEDLGCAGISVLDGLSDILRDTQHVVVLADSVGRIFYSVGHRQIKDKLEKINFRPGAAWSEQTVGPNGVGSPLSSGQPEVVMGHEHYCQGWHPWVCYGAPIYDSTGQNILGSVDITGPVKNLNREAMVLAMSVAQSIQSGLSILQYHRRELLREIAREKLQRWPSDGVMFLDENGFIVEYNSKAVKFLNLDSSEFFNTTVSQFFPDLSETVQRCFIEKKEIKINIHKEGQSGLLQPIKICIEPMMSNNKCLGTALIMIDSAQCNVVKKSVNPNPVSLQSKYTFKNIKGNSENIKKSVRIAKAAASDPLESNVLLYGETGTGKELLAHSIHAESGRKNGPFVAINCAALPRDLIESELFGYAPGAFTGASRNGLKGKFEAAHNGTLFLDEINSMSLELQAKFLRVLDSMEINRIGSVEPILVSARIIAAANEEINSAVEEGTFRIDLFHRLNAIEISIPKLSERGSDIVELANEFLEKQCIASGKEKITLSPEVTDIMQGYHWPGNIRELYNVCVCWVLTVSGSTVIYTDVPERISKVEITTRPIAAENIRSINDELIKQTLTKTGNNVSKAARILGIDRTTIYRRRRNW